MDLHSSLLVLQGMIKSTSGQKPSGDMPWLIREGDSRDPNRQLKTNLEGIVDIPRHLRVCKV